MSAAIVSAFHQDYRDLYKGLQSHRATTDFRQQVSALERQLTGQLVNSYAASSFINIPAANQGSPVPPILKNLPNLTSLKSPTKQHAPLTSSNSVAICNVASHLKSTSATKEHRKLDRSVSEPVDRSQANLKSAPPNSSRYKTELCRPFEENGTCKYGDKCQFAHGINELRTLTRHPKYKTELCRTFHSTGFCPYGPRCHFIHNSDDIRKCILNTLQHTNNPSGGATLTPPSLSPPILPRDLELFNFNNLGSTGELSPTHSSNSSGSPTSSVNSFTLEDNHMPYNLPQVPQTAPPTMTSGFFFGSDYVSTSSNVFHRPSQQELYAPRKNFEPEDNPMLSSINLLVSEMDNLNCLDETVKTELSPKSEELDANSNIRLPVFSWLAHGSSP